MDGLTDYEEVYLTETNPNVYDSVTKGIADTDADGVTDGNEYFEQIVDSSRFDDVLFADNCLLPEKIILNANGNVNNNVKISEYTGHLKGNERAYVGKALEISNVTMTSGSITYKLTNDYPVKEYELDGDKTNGLLICYNDGENTTPLKTVYDEETRTLTADISSEGIYFVIDVIDWVDSLGIELEFEEEKQDIAPLRYSDLNIADVKVKGQVDIVFLVDTTGSMGSYISNVKSNLTAFVNEIEAAGIVPSFALVEYKDITCDGNSSTKVKTNGNTAWFTDTESFKAQISKLTATGGGDYEETLIDALEKARQLDLRETAQKFFIVVTDADYKVANNYGIASMKEMSDLLAEDEINVSVVSNSECMASYNELYQNTNGVFANITGIFKDELLSIADKIDDETNNGYWIALNGLIPQVVKLDAQPSMQSDSDTDMDTLMDNEELVSVKPLGYIDITLYINILMDKPNGKSTVIPLYDYYSNPTQIDTDYDGLDDEEEYAIGTSRKIEDTDNDGLDDEWEHLNWYDPLNSNPDGDSYNDSEENTNETDPFSYDLTKEDWIEGIKNGAIKGDLIKNPSIPELIGQIGSSVTPFVGTVGDIRDTLANAARGEWFMAGLSIFGIVPAAGDVSKSLSKVTKFLSKNLDNIDEVAELLITLEKHFPNMVGELIPPSAADTIIKEIQEGDLQVSKSYYYKLVEICKKLGKKTSTIIDDFPSAKKVVSSEDVWSKGYFKRGNLIDELLGNNLGKTYKTYDIFDEDTSIAISIKSLDPRCTSYQDASKLRNTLNRYGKKLLDGDSTIMYKGIPHEISSKKLELALPDVPITKDQKQVIDNFIETNKKNFEVQITIIS